MSLNRSSQGAEPAVEHPIRVWKHTANAGPSLTLKFRQRASLVHGDVISFVALDLILRITFSAMMYVTLILHVACVFLDDNTFNVSGQLGLVQQYLSRVGLLRQ